MVPSGFCLGFNATENGKGFAFSWVYFRSFKLWRINNRTRKSIRHLIEILEVVERSVPRTTPTCSLALVLFEITGDKVINLLNLW